VIILDGAAMLYRLELAKSKDSYLVNRELGLQLSYLTEIARKKNIPVLVTNQVYADLDAGRLPWMKGYILSREDEIRRQTIMRVMCDLELDFSAMSESLGVDFKNHFAAELDSLADLEADGLVERSDNRFVVTESGRLFIRVIAMRFDEYLVKGKKNQKGRFSKVI